MNKIDYNIAWSKTRQCANKGILLPYQYAIVASVAETTAAQVFYDRESQALNSKARTQVRNDYIQRLRKARNPNHRNNLIYSYRLLVRELGNYWI